MRPTSRLRQLLARDGILSVPGVYDTLTARVAERVGFEATYMTGAGISNARVGVPAAPPAPLRSGPRPVYP